MRLPYPLLLLLLTGCGNDRPYSGPPPGMPRRAQAAPANTPVAPRDPTPGGAPDPLIGDSGQTPPDPLIGPDPLTVGDSLTAHGMPTAHSHWLRGRLRDAHLTVLLNGVRHGSFSGVVDQDITMKLREGANTVTFLYQPEGPGSAADIEVIESEHHPPIAPLVTFHSASAPLAGGTAPAGDDLKPETKTFPFVAH